MSDNWERNHDRSTNPTPTGPFCHLSTNYYPNTPTATSCSSLRLRALDALAPGPGIIFAIYADWGRGPDEGHPTCWILGFPSSQNRFDSSRLKLDSRLIRYFTNLPGENQRSPTFPASQSSPNPAILSPKCKCQSILPSLKLTVRPWNWAIPKGKFIFQPSIFRGYVTLKSIHLVTHYINHLRISKKKKLKSGMIPSLK